MSQVDPSKRKFDYIIDPGRGLGSIRFGFNTSDVQRELGDPEEQELFDPLTNTAKAWLYTALDVAVFFQKDCSPLSPQQWRVTNLGTGHPQATLWGANIIGRTRGEIESLVRDKGVTDLIPREDAYSGCDLAVLGSDTLKLEFDFRDGLLVNVSLSQG